MHLKRLPMLIVLMPLLPAAARAQSASDTVPSSPSTVPGSARRSRARRRTPASTPPMGSCCLPTGCRCEDAWTSRTGCAGPGRRRPSPCARRAFRSMRSAFSATAGSSTARRSAAPESGRRPGSLRHQVPGPPPAWRRWELAGEPPDVERQRVAAMLRYLVTKARLAPSWPAASPGRGAERMPRSHRAGA